MSKLIIIPPNMQALLTWIQDYIRNPNTLMGTFPQDLEAYLSTIVNTLDEKASANAMMAERDQLQNKVIEVQTALEEADATNLAQGTKISELKGQLRKARASLQLALQAERPTKEDKANISNPARFDGSNKDKYRIFTSQLRLKTMPWASEQEKLRYAVSLLAGTDRKSTRLNSSH